MKFGTFAVFALGVSGGLLVANLLIEPSDCCQRVGDAVRDKVGDKLGTTAQTVGDFFGVWKFTPGLLKLFGV